MAKGSRVTMKCFHDGVTGSSIMLKIKRPGQNFKKVLIDWGGYQEEKYDILNRVVEFDPGEVDAVVVTHSHIDHIYKLPILYKYGYSGDIYCSEKAIKSIDIALSDCVRIMYHDNTEHGIPMLYDNREKSLLINNMTGLKFNTSLEILPDVFLTLLGNGHLYGAACVLLQVKCKNYKDINMLFTGDYNRENELFTPAPIPEWVYKLPNLSIITESTYGNSKKSDVKETFTSSINKWIGKGNNLVLPVISQERAELVLLKLKKMQEEGKLNSDIPIYIHSELGKNYYFSVYNKSKDIIPCMPVNCKFIEKGDFSSFLEDTRSPKILLASSGMADKGTILFYLPFYLNNPNATILFTCYQGKNTLGNKIKNSKFGGKIWIKGEEFERICNVDFTGEFSRHIKQDEAIEFFKKFEHLTNIFINHGEKQTKAIYAHVLSNTFQDINVFVMNRAVGFRIAANGPVTTYDTNLPTVEYYVNLENSKKVTKASKKNVIKKRLNKKRRC